MLKLTYEQALELIHTIFNLSHLSQPDSALSETESFTTSPTDILNRTQDIVQDLPLPTTAYYDSFFQYNNQLFSDKLQATT